MSDQTSATESVSPTSQEDCETETQFSSETDNLYNESWLGKHFPSAGTTVKNLQTETGLKLSEVDKLLSKLCRQQKIVNMSGRWYQVGCQIPDSLDFEPKTPSPPKSAPLSPVFPVRFDTKLNISSPWKWEPWDANDAELITDLMIDTLQTHLSLMKELRTSTAEKARTALNNYERNISSTLQKYSLRANIGQEMPCDAAYLANPTFSDEYIARSMKIFLDNMSQNMDAIFSSDNPPDICRFLVALFRGNFEHERTLRECVDKRV